MRGHVVNEGDDFGIDSGHRVRSADVVELVRTGLMNDQRPPVHVDSGDGIRQCAVERTRTQTSADDQHTQRTTASAEP